MILLRVRLCACADCDRNTPCGGRARSFSDRSKTKCLRSSIRASFSLLFNSNLLSSKESSFSMGVKQSKVVLRNSFDRVRRLARRKTRVVAIPPGEACSIRRSDARNHRSSPSPSTSVPKRRPEREHLVLEDLEDLSAEELYGFDVAQFAMDIGRPGRLLGGRAAEYMAKSRPKVAQCTVASSPICDHPCFIPDTIALEKSEVLCKLYNYSTAFNFLLSLTQAHPAIIAELAFPIACVVPASSEDLISVSSGDSDSLTEVTSIDSMSIDSELLSILRATGERSQRSPSPHTSLFREEDDTIDLSQLVLMFSSKEEEETVAMEQLPDYVLFMSLPSSTSTPQ